VRLDYAQAAMPRVMRGEGIAWCVALVADPVADMLHDAGRSSIACPRWRCRMPNSRYLSCSSRWTNCSVGMKATASSMQRQ